LSSVIFTLFENFVTPIVFKRTRLGLATVVIWHAADHYGQMLLYLRENGIVPPRELKDTY